MLCFVSWFCDVCVVKAVMLFLSICFCFVFVASRDVGVELLYLGFLCPVICFYLSTRFEFFWCVCCVLFRVMVLRCVCRESSDVIFLLSVFVLCLLSLEMLASNCYFFFSLVFCLLLPLRFQFWGRLCCV